MSEKIDIRITNDLSEIERVQNLIDAFGKERGLIRTTVLNMQLAAEELLSNIISYGYEDDDEHTITLHIAHEDTAVTIRIRHDADPFNPMELPEPKIEASLEDMTIGGLGIHLIKQMMDGFEFIREGKYSTIVLSIDI